MLDNLFLWGASVGAVLAGLILLFKPYLERVEFLDRTLTVWATALATGLLVGLANYADQVAAALPWAPEVVFGVTLVLGAILAVLGAMPSLSRAANFAVQSIKEHAEVRTYTLEAQFEQVEEI